MDPLNFLKEVQQIPDQYGDGFTRTVPIQLHSLRNSSGLTLDASTTNPRLAALETNFLGMQWLAGNAAVAVLNWTVPIDYDETADRLDIVVLCNSAGDTDTPTLDANVYQKRAGASLSADLDATASAAISNNTAKAAERVIKIRSEGLRAGDVLSIHLFPGTHATDAVNVYGLGVRYKSTLVSYRLSHRDPS